MHVGLDEPVGRVRTMSAIEQRGPWVRVFRSGVTLAAHAGERAGGAFSASRRKYRRPGYSLFQG
jgi:hypothetical protein